MAAAVANHCPAAFEAWKSLVGTEQVARSATAHKIVQTVIATMRRPAQALDIAARRCPPMDSVAAILPVMVVALVPVAAIRPSAMVAAAQVLVVASRVVAVTRDWAVVEVERLRSCHKSGHYPVDLLRNWRIVAYYYTPE